MRFKHRRSTGSSNIKWPLPPLFTFYDTRTLRVYQFSNTNFFIINKTTNINFKFGKDDEKTQVNKLLVSNMLTSKPPTDFVNLGFPCYHIIDL